jgi:EAL domain-containing protein (putative c-di-GMP-specific phosphodiesterase class I)
MVEMSEQLDVLRQQGCHEAQRFLLSKPLPPLDCAALVALERESLAREIA